MPAWPGSAPAVAPAFEPSIWRAVAVFRIATFVYAATLTAANFREYGHPVAGWIVIAVIGAWSAFTVAAYAKPRARRWPLLAVDLAVTAACLLASRPIVGAAQLHDSAPTLTITWMACPVIAVAILYGRTWGAVTAAAMGVVDVTTRGVFSQATYTGTVVMVFTALAVGHLARLTQVAQERLRKAAAMDAATRERDRMARAIHDNVLQIVTLVQRRATEMGGEAAELAQLAAEQEAVLRGLISHASAEAEAVGVADLRLGVQRLASAAVSIAVPATAVWLPSGTAADLVAAVQAALDNVRRHAGDGARAWVLIEDEADAVTVTVRDDGAGIPAGRLATAAAEGRMGVAQSIDGRIADVGGTVSIESAPGAGTEIELRVPRTPKRRRR